MRENLDYQNFTDESKKEKAHVIANRIEDQFKQFNIPFGLVMLISDVELYKTIDKRTAKLVIDKRRKFKNS